MFEPDVSFYSYRILLNLPRQFRWPHISLERFITHSHPTVYRFIPRVGVAEIIIAVSGPDRWPLIHDQDKNIDKTRI